MWLCEKMQWRLALIWMIALSACDSNLSLHTSGDSAEVELDTELKEFLALGLPEQYSNAVKFSVVFAGFEKKTLQQKYGPKSAIDCHADDSYQTVEVGNKHPLTVDVIEIPDGPIRLCIRTMTKGNMNLLSNLLLDHVWIKDTVVPELTVEVPLINPANLSTSSALGNCSEEGLKVELSGAVTQSAVCSGGVWQSLLDVSGLSDGAHKLSAKLTDLAGNETVVSKEFEKYTIPATLSIQGPTIVASNKTAVNLSGQCSENGSPVTLSGALTASATCNSGAWTYTADLSQQPEGTVVIHASHSNKAGTGSESVDLFKDTLVPVVTIDSVVINAGNVASVPLSGTCSEDGRDVAIDAGGVLSWPVCTGSSWSINMNLSTLNDGNVNVVAVQSDEVGNQGSVLATLTKDVSIPSVAFDNTLANHPITGANESSYTLSGQCSENGKDVAITGAMSHTVSCSAGTWAYTSDASGLPEGFVAVTVTHTDAAGNTGTANVTLKKDTVPPVAGGGLALTTSSLDGITFSPTWTKATDTQTVAGDLKYQVYYSTSSSFSSLGDVEAGTPVGTAQKDIAGATIDKLDANTTYYVNVVVADGVGNKATYGAPVSALENFETSCNNVRVNRAVTVDGDYQIDPDGPGANNPPFYIYCAGMSTATPSSYLSLVNSKENGSSDKNMGLQATYNSLCPCNDATIFFNKVKIDLSTLIVDRDDKTYTESDGDYACHVAQANCYVDTYKWGDTMGARGASSPQAWANIDLAATPFAVASSVSWALTGWAPVGYTNFSDDRHVVDIGGDGYSGGNIVNTPMELEFHYQPRKVTATVAGTGITINSHPVPGATSYTIYWNTVGGPDTTSAKLANVTLPYTHEGLSSGVTYYYVVTANISGTESPISAEASATIP